MDTDEPRLPYPAYLNDGLEPIWCRDEHQAKLILGLWRAARMVGGKPPLHAVSQEIRECE